MYVYITMCVCLCSEATDNDAQVLDMLRRVRRRRRAEDAPGHGNWGISRALYLRNNRPSMSHLNSRRWQVFGVHFEGQVWASGIMSNMCTEEWKNGRLTTWIVPGNLLCLAFHRSKGLSEIAGHRWLHVGWVSLRHWASSRIIHQDTRKWRSLIDK